MVVPLVFRGRGYGVLIAVDRLEGGPAFSREDQRLLEAFAASAATAVATAVTVEAERRRQRLAAAEQERAHWARELHDETLQNLAALRLGLAAQLRDSRPEAVIEAVREAVAQLEREIRTLRALVTDLRPAALDDLGAQAAIEDLAERARGRGLEVDLPSTSPTSRAASRTDTRARSRPRCTASSRRRSTTPQARRCAPRPRRDRGRRLDRASDGAGRWTGFDPIARTTGSGCSGCGSGSSYCRERSRSDRRRGRARRSTPHSPPPTAEAPSARQSNPTP